MSKVNKTLLVNLFLEPNPQPERPQIKYLFEKMSYRMFPGRDNFIEYLRTQNIDKQYILAEKIIHQLCFISNFPPTYFSIKDILCVETYQKGKYTEEDYFIPRDHFIHLVNIYLLGLYIFFYNADFFNRIIKDNQFQREKEPFFQPAINEVKDFISEWRYFTLYHDIGYVPEILSNNKKVSNIGDTYRELRKIPDDFQESLSEETPLKQVSFLGTIEIMSKIFMTRFIINNSSKRLTLSHKCFGSFADGKVLKIFNDEEYVVDDLEKELVNTFDNTFFIEKIYSNACLKPILPVVDANSIFVIGIHKNTGKLAFISFVEDNNRKMILSDAFRGNNEIEELLHRPQLILYDEYFSNDFELDYVIDKAKAEETIEKKTMLDIDNINNAFLLVESELQIKYASISREEQFLDFIFDIYLFLYTLLRKYMVPGKAPINITAAQKYDEFINNELKLGPERNSTDWVNSINRLRELILKLANKPFFEDIRSSCMKFASTVELKKTPKKNNSNTSEAIDDLVDTYFKQLKAKIESKDAISVLKAEIKESYCNQMEQIIALIMNYSIIYSGLKDIFTKEDKVERKEDYSFGYFFEYDKRRENTTKRNDMFCEKFIGNKSAGAYKKVLEEYIIQHGNTINHGFASTKYAAAMFDFLQRSINNNSKNEIEWKLIDILFDISNPDKNSDYLAKYVTNYNHIFENVLYVIFIHDIYPDKFTNESDYYGMKTSMNDPFSYLSLLADGLQDWNRPQTLSSSLLDVRSYDHVSDSYDINVSEKGIFLYEEGIEKSQDRLVKNINGMTHLKNVKAILKNGYVKNEPYT